MIHGVRRKQYHSQCQTIHVEYLHCIAGYQILVGGRSDAKVALGDILGRAVKFDDVPGIVETLVSVYLRERQDGERFIDTAERIGKQPFKAAVYPEKAAA